MRTRAVVQHLDLKSPEALFIGLAWSPDGSRLYAAAGGNGKIRVYSFSGGRLVEGASIALLNTPSSPMAAQSAGWDFSTADQAPEDQLNLAIWQSVKGAGTPMPGA